MEFILNNVPQIVGCFLICGMKIVEITIQSLRTVFMIKGERLIASILAFIECVVWGFVVSSIITSLSENIYWLFAYCGGFAFGIYVGSFVESKIALGTVNLQVMVCKKYTEKITEYLNEHNRGYAVIDGHGSKGPTSIINIVIPRKDRKELVSKIEEICNSNVFWLSSDVNKFMGGYGIRK